ncbi:hypothetical protein IM792_02140 [Mucilaginibacter sp. JRF]|uniref:hypothetical protein n=1 Tax=Mucilaginibacter sp. JRF TaxID=2780088 RepID=UPI001881AD89|nr:hypothetical protein [Mucilaginibacter sp. JRF]MBE9583238.1 hypothetical protein [Mucilaginibacter sp. JRF]
MSNYRITIWLVSLLILNSVSVLQAQVFEKTPELHGDTVVFPISLINVYPFISGNVNGVEGKFMFDTGYRTSMALNDNYIKLPNKRSKSSGSTGSGQTFVTNTNDTIREVRLANGITYRNLENISSANYDFIQKNITTDFLGFIGHDFFQGYLFKLDYQHRKVTFYRSTAERSQSKDFLKNEKVLAVIDFEIRKLANHPFVKLNIDGVNVIGAFDTGQNGLLQLDAPSAELLKRRGSVLASGKDSYGDTLLNIKNITIDGKLKTTLKGVELAHLKATQLEREKSGITESNLMNIGYRFLAQYKTVWDYAHQKIYVLEY